MLSSSSFVLRFLACPEALHLHTILMRPLYFLAPSVSYSTLKLPSSATHVVSSLRFTYNIVQPSPNVRGKSMPGDPSVSILADQGGGENLHCLHVVHLSHVLHIFHPIHLLALIPLLPLLNPNPNHNSNPTLIPTLTLTITITLTLTDPTLTLTLTLRP